MVAMKIYFLLTHVIQFRLCLIKAGSTLRSSQAAPHPSTNRALRRLTSEVRRDPVHSTRYGRRRRGRSFCVEIKWLKKSQFLLLKEKADSTLRSSQAVPHPSTSRALCRLTSEVERDPVHSTRYGRQRIPLNTPTRQLLRDSQ